MDSIFYSVLTNQRNFDMTPDSWINVTLRRKVFSTPWGAYVVVDRFDMGPQFAKQLWSVHNIPVSLGADGTVEALQIYLRTDGMRLAQEDRLSPFRRLLNNWFGLVPALAMVLPPSFNQNYLYDPISLVETPFSFPLSVDKFETMPIGSIRSYALSGGINLSPDLGGLADQETRAVMARIGGLQFGAPYSVFKRGEHRINVLRRGEHIAWVGVSDLNRTGNGITPLIGQQYYLLYGALAAKVGKYGFVWKGMPVNILPLNLSYEHALAKLFDQVYEFDLANPVAVEAYEAAVRGDFEPAHRRYLDAKEQHKESGVAFHFARHQDRVETVEKNGPNVVIYKKERQLSHTHAEVEITDTAGKFYVLESILDVADKTSNVLVPEREARSQQALEMNVKKVVSKDNPNDPTDYTYAFAVDAEHYRLTMALSFQDKYVDTVSYASYLDQLRYFTAMPLADTPVFRPRAVDQEAEWRRQGFFSDPHAQVGLIHVTPTYIGKFGAQASLSFSAKELDRMIATDEDSLWVAFANAYGVDESAWGNPAVRASLGFQSQWFTAFFAYPLRLFNVRFPEADAIVEATKGVKAFMSLKTLATPMEKLDGFYHLLDSDHPRELARALLNLSNLGDVPRRVTLTAQAKGPAKDDVKKAFGDLNNRTFRAGPPFPEASRYAKAKAELSNFYLDQPRVGERRPRIVQIQVTPRLIPESVRALSLNPAEPGLDRNDKQVFATFSVRGVIPDVPLKIYARIEQAGKIKLGKLDLSEKVVELMPMDRSSGPEGQLTYELFLTGPLSPLDNYMLSQATAAGDDFQVIMAVSLDGDVWSDERSLEFRYDDGELFPVDQ
jgi:hypothetical protein